MWRALNSSSSTHLFNRVSNLDFVLVFSTYTGPMPVPGDGLLEDEAGHSLPAGTAGSTGRTPRGTGLFVVVFLNPVSLTPARVHPMK